MLRLNCALHAPRVSRTECRIADINRLPHDLAKVLIEYGSLKLGCSLVVYRSGFMLFCKVTSGF